MKLLLRNLFFLVLINFILIYVNFASAQNISKFQYINPLPNSSFVSVSSNIIIRPGSIIDGASLNDNIITVIGSSSGKHSGKTVLSVDSKNIIFDPYKSFNTNEEVRVILKNGLKTLTGSQIDGLTFKFHTCRNKNTRIPEESSAEFNPSNIENETSSVPDTSLPSNLARVSAEISNNPFDGYIFLTPPTYILIVDNQGTPVFYRNVRGTAYNFDLQSNGELTYFVYPNECYGLDSSLNIERTFNVTNGYSIDVHDLRVLPNGNYFIFGKRIVTVDMSHYVEGGDTAASVIDGALQEFDSNDSLIFQWDALDHYNITDVDSNIDLTQPTIDFSHFNSVEIDTDNTVLISARNLDEITKVDLNTGDIIWRLGGKNNQFTFINDNIGFSRQHDIRRFSNGNISLFDNGNYHPVRVSSAVEYQLDELNKTATLVRRFTYKNIWTITEGSVQELPNGNRLISWGHNWNPIITEVTPDDSIALDLSYSQYHETYRGFKYNWHPNLFRTNTDSIDFGNINPGDSILTNLTIINNRETAVEINEFYCNDPAFTTNFNVPVVIGPNDSISVPVQFKPLHDGNYKAAFNIRNFSEYVGSQQMIAKQVFLSGTTTGVTSVNSHSETIKIFELSQNFPNPFNPSTVIDYQLPVNGQVNLKIYDVLGREVSTLVNEYKTAGKYKVKFNASNLPSGIYIYKLQEGNFVQTKKMILLK